MNTKNLGALVTVASAVAMLTVGTGCMVRASAAPPEPVYVTAETVPVNIETYPAIEYEGHPTYYVGGRWYHRRAGSWVYYRSEPAELQRRRPPPREERREERHEERHEDHHEGGRR